MKKLITILLLFVSFYSYSQIKTIKIRGDSNLIKASVYYMLDSAIAAHGGVSVVTASAPLSITSTPTLTPNVVADTTTATSTALVNQRQLLEAGNWIRIGTDIYNANTGNVGVGTSTPTEQLTIKAATPTTNYMGFYDNSGNVQGQIFQTSGTTSRQFLLNMTDTTGKGGVSDNWIGFRYGGASNKIFFGNNSVNSFMQSNHPIRFSVGGGTPTTISVPIMTLTSAALGIGITSPATSSLLDLTSTTKGLLMPRQTVAERDAISSPANGLMVYNTEDSTVSVYKGAWKNVPRMSKSITTTGSDLTDTTNLAAIKNSSLQLWANANKKYKITAEVYIGCDNTGGVRFSLNAPSGATLQAGTVIGASTNANLIQQAKIPAIASLTTSGAAFLRANSQFGLVTIIAYITTSSTAGNVGITFASATGGQISTIIAGSTMDITQIE